jgi:hypothetical protein
MFEFTTWHAGFVDFLISLRHYTVIGNQLFISNDRNKVRWVVLELLQDGTRTDFFENLSENTLKGDLSNDTTFNPPLFSLVDTFKWRRKNSTFIWKYSSTTAIEIRLVSVLSMVWQMIHGYWKRNAGTKNSIHRCNSQNRTFKENVSPPRG